mmetsp:Transcript_72309/g.182344  ORF Transcript_72309/g.182344 Transcript_72309/m.182344 type:complete len:426 (+) Transcript_72309:111-1388(+)
MGAAWGCENSGEEEESKSIWDLYDIGDTLGRGNFGEVRACRRRNAATDGDEELAVKIVDKQSEQVQSAEAFQTARAELEIMSGITHPNVVELKAVFEDDRFLYVVMERIEGGELFKAISDRRAVIIEDDVANVGHQVLEAVEYLHHAGIVHRDIKAQNILLQDQPKVPGRALMRAGVKLIDFGLATKVNQECLMNAENQLDLVCGTPAMCAPEIWATQDNAPKAWKRYWGTSYGPKVDVWATGVVLYMALFGRLPFHEKEAKKLAAKVCDPKEVPSFQTKGGYQVSSGCQKFLGSLLTKDQNKRPSAAQACGDGWLNGRNSRGARTRGLNLMSIPEEVREAALLEAEAALQMRFTEEAAWPTAPGEDVAAERSRTFEALRAEAASAQASARSRPLPLQRDSRFGSAAFSDSEGSEDEDGAGGFGC